MIDFTKTFETARVLLRPMQVEDFEPMIPLTSDPEMWTYFTSDLSIETDLKKWVESGASATNRLALTVIDAQTKEIIGSTSIGNISARDKRAEIGWTWIAKSHQGKGFNPHVKSILLKYLMEDCGLERVELKTDVLNIPARKAMSKIGLVEEGVLRSHTQMIRNRRRDTIFYSILKDEWAEMKAKNNW